MNVVDEHTSKPALRERPGVHLSLLVLLLPLLPQLLALLGPLIVLLPVPLASGFVAVPAAPITPAVEVIGVRPPRGLVALALSLGLAFAGVPVGLPFHAFVCMPHIITCTAAAAPNRFP